MRLNLIFFYILLGVVLCVRSAPLPLATSKIEDGSKPSDVSTSGLRHWTKKNGRWVFSPKRLDRPGQRHIQEHQLASTGGSISSQHSLEGHPNAIDGEKRWLSTPPSTTLIARFFKDGGWKFWNKNKAGQAQAKPIQVHVHTETQSFGGGGKIVRRPAISRPVRFPQTPGKGKEPIRPNPNHLYPTVRPQGPRPMKSA
ncbi:hypothetical protein GALMADRAFT_144702 [Galerina marginata CBS 339.88]|uniref:Secreted protein n=1 Tax=Galerina marginata (strain CBS 339.88) TaxID=685588 RepID=A0A067SUG1_GALM3|nr:hypothetical protein GALMADRAFT_144702 [Galerina marginata CBS 339.88]